MRRVEHWGRRMLVGLVAGLVACWLAPSAAHAEFMMPDLVEVPVKRLIGNVTQQLAAKPNDAGLWFNLARLHAMAYASKSDTAKVWRGRENRGPWFGYTPRNVPYRLRPTKDPGQLKEAQRHLGRAIEIHEKVLKLKPDHTVARLGYGWCLQQAGRRDQAIQAYRQTIEEAWKKEGQLRAGRMGGRYVVAEAADYLVPLLDPLKDAREIAALRQRAEQLRRLPRPVTPIAIPLREGLAAEDLVDPHARVAFDADGSGRRHQWTWVTPDAGWLVMDRHGHGRITSALQMFGSVSFWLFWENGYQALAALDDNQDGRLAGAELAGLAVWRDANANGISEPGEVRPLAEWRIVALACHHETDAAHPDGIRFSPQGVVLSDGTTRPTFDLILHPRQATERR